MSKKYLYYFSEGNEAFGGDKVTMKNTLGGKGAGLAEMTAAGMPVPQGFTITTDACTQYYADGRQINDEITADIFEHLKGLEKITGKKFGDNTNPLLVSVRSGARQSMPGMMDTILNLGLNDEAVEGLAKKTGNTRFAYDCYRRFVQMFADVVMMVPKSLFEVEIDKMKEAKGVKNDVDLTADDLKELVGTFKKIYEENEGRPFPQDPRDQLIEAVKAVFRSWDNPRANVYRKMNEIPYEWGTAVNVQQMAFGNSGDRSGTGVAFTRDPATGAKKLMGEYLINAQGEDVVAGVRTPSPISHLKDQMPEVYDQFVEIATRLENYFRDMQDMEFTIEDGHLYMLQTRNGKRTAQAALQIACDLVDEGMITEQEAVLRVEPKQLDTLLHPQFDAAALKAAEVVGKGLAASPGSACGQIVFTAEEAEEMVKSGKMKKVVLVRLETSPEDIVGMQVSQGILTVRGGMWILDHVERRMAKAHPALTFVRPKRQQTDTFAAGCSPYKIILLFFIGAFLGDITETIFCRVTGGEWMSRSSVVWGAFAIVWGLAIAKVTQLLYRYKDKPASWLFVMGTLLGGAYEYLCSVFTEVVFGAVFWDYSAIPFNLGGRINLLYCFFWGIAAVTWIRYGYPLVAKGMKAVKRRIRPWMTALLAVFMAVNLVTSALALARYDARTSGAAPANAVDVLLDEHFDNARMERIYPNAKKVEKAG